MKRLVVLGTSNIFIICLWCLTLIFNSACTQDKAQDDFENQARMAPAGIQEMNATGVHPDKGEDDDDDWRTSPKFSGIFRISTAAFPNPVAFNSSFEIQIYTALNSITGLYVYAFQLSFDFQSAKLVKAIQGNLPGGLQTIQISPQTFAQSGQTRPNSAIYRIIIFNGRQEVLSYGDVRVK